VRIAILVEGKTEMVFMPALRKFLQSRLAGRMPKIDPVPYNGRIPKSDKLQRVVQTLLSDPRQPADAVIALTDIYTGTDDFVNAADAKSKMKSWVENNPNFYPHVAQYDFEAWLLPFWPTIQKMAKHQKGAPPGAPEMVNHNNPPAHRIAEIFELGKCRDSYSKPRDAKRILESNDLLISAEACSELKSFLNTILRLSGGEPIQ
jgi:hypothetical protein